MSALLPFNRIARFCMTASVAVAAMLANVASTEAGALKTLHNFADCADGKCRDGGAPGGNLARDAAGNLYGTTAVGGKNNAGTIFQLTPDGKGGWIHSTLYSFCSEEGCADGATPQGALAIDESGNLFGAALNAGKDKGGVVYRLQPDGKLHVLHSFCGAKNCNGSRYPNGVILDATGHLFGVASTGGKKGAGTVFELAN